MRVAREWEEEDILRLVKDRASESINLEFKRCDALTNKGWKRELAKDVSAMANSAGGTIVYGIIEDPATHEAESIDRGYDPSALNVETLEQVIHSHIQRNITGVIYKAIPLKKHDPVRVLYLINVPESSHAPHMADHRFYKRHNFMSVSMEEHEVRERYRRETYPGKDIVEAWRDDAINPLLGVLEFEKICLKKDVWTLSRNRKEFDGLKLIANQPNVSPNAEDFVSRHPEIDTLLKEHDAALASVNDAGKVLFEMVANSSFIRDVFAEASTEESLIALKAASKNVLRGNTPAELFAEVFGSNTTDQQRFDYFAESLINGVQDTNIESWILFWRTYGERFRNLVVYPPLSEYRRRVSEERDKLLKVTQSLIATLRKTRRELSERHNVAVAPSRRGFVDPYPTLGYRNKFT